MGGTIGPVPDRIATDLLRIARDPGTGRLRHTQRLEVALRAALFSDLALAGHLATMAAAPIATESGPPEDRILAAVWTTVTRRRSVRWSRWYRHVRVDRVALVDELTSAERWQVGRGVPRTYVESDLGGALELREHVLAVIESRGEVRDAHDAVLALLAAMSGVADGRVRTGVLSGELGRLLAHVGESDEVPRRTVEAALRAAAPRIRRPNRRGSLFASLRSKP